MFRRDLKLFAASLKALALLTVLLLAGCIGTAFVISGSEISTATKLSIVICNLDSGSQSGSMILGAASGHELVSSLLDLRFVDTEEEAIHAVEDGAVAAVVLPEGFFRSTAHGESLPCRMILGSAGEGSQGVIKTYAEVGAEALNSGQLLVFTGDYYMLSIEAPPEVAEDFNLYMNLYSFSEFEDAKDRYFQIVDIPYTSGGLSKAAHYTAIYLSFFFCMLILGYYRLYQADMDRSRQLMLRSSGLSERQYLRWKWALPFAFCLLLMVAFLLVIPRFLPLSIDISTVFSALFALLFVAVFGAFLSIGFSGISGAVLFSVQIIGLFFCGGIIPYSRLTPWILSIGNVTPLGVVYRSLSPLFGGSFSPTALIIGLLYAALMFLFCHLRIRRILAGKEAA